MTWKRLCIFWMAVSLLLVYLLGITVPIACSAELKLYDAMTFKNKPASVELGCIRAPFLYQWGLHGGASTPDKDYSKPDGKHYAEAARAERDKGTTEIWLNLEAWNYDLRLGSVIAEKHMLNRLATLALWRAEAPSLRVYAYNWTIGNQSLYWSFATDRVLPDRRLEWRRWNERYAKPVLQAQAAIFPSCYLRHGYSHTLYRRIHGNHLAEIERLAPDTPIYPFVRFRYANKKFVEPKRLQQAIEYLKSLDVDGFVLWSKPSASVPWEGKPRKLFEVIKEAAQ